MQTSFRVLHENASDYLASLQTTRAEELMLTEQFLVFKDTLTNYLQNFMIGLQKYGTQVEGLIHGGDSDVWRAFLSAVVEDEMRTPSLDEVLSAEERLERRMEEWTIFTRWFIGSETEASDVVFLERATKDTIGRMVRYAIAIQEKQRLGISRRRELDYLGQWFLGLESVEEAHKLGAAVYGLMKPRHFQGEPPRSSDSTDLSMWDEEPITRALSSRSRVRRRAGTTEPVKVRDGEQAEAKQVLLAQLEREAAVVRWFLELGAFHLSDLDVLTVEQRRVLLSWISRCLVSKSKQIRTADGYHIELSLPQSDDRTELSFSDGQLDMPNFHLSVREASRT
ncbi:TIGR02677 family protein [Alicyclobacillus dauci]|uniref:TIGR02677 family protein n=1 Tax=Alicyclobacillus dauci TaxID=1475485 RepID=A0ABY6Z205_9BACL|nr:TIGR02677 family protein [Alicyclobacillus dauci]WAH36351.1 TIGR02677 family protein [Alicyclobacillus dauci]